MGAPRLVAPWDKLAARPVCCYPTWMWVKNEKTAFDLSAR